MSADAASALLIGLWGAVRRLQAVNTRATLLRLHPCVFGTYT